MSDEPRQLVIDLSAQRLTLFEQGERVCSYPVSTAANGAGEERDSGRTPRGRHRIRIKIGEGEPENRVFVGRRPSDEIYSPALAQEYPERDWILTRILWLTGIEPGFNRGGRRDTLRRFIYIHGCPEEEPLGIPRSHGCIRMHNRDLLELFARVENGTLVEIRE